MVVGSGHREEGEVFFVAAQASLLGKNETKDWSSGSGQLR
jgi:hypothetical protein